MATTLDHLINDKRLARLFSSESDDCALQLWVLHIKSDHSPENRVIYARLLPYSFSNNCWSASNNDNFKAFGKREAKIVQLNLYIKSTNCPALLKQLSAGRTIADISDELSLCCPKNFKERFGSTALAADSLIYRPVAYLINRDAHETKSLSSPHGQAGALSASISRTDKTELFLLDQEYNADLIKFLIEQLKQHTGLDFDDTDAARFGDLELLVFPALDDCERPLLDITSNNAINALTITFNPKQVSHFVSFQFRICISNSDEPIYSSISTAQKNAAGTFSATFQISESLNEITDSTELEIFGVENDASGHGELCCRFKINYIREINLQSSLVGSTRTVKFDWLERTVISNPEEPRVKAALTIKRDELGFNSMIGGREVDAWVPANNNLKALLKRIHPPKSDGNFFPRMNQGEGNGRLQFVEWFKALLTKYRQHQVVIFDPYFDSAGLGLLLLSAVPKCEYIIFRSLPEKNAPASSSTKNGVDNLITNCKQNHRLMQGINLRIHGVKHGALHDRYILIADTDGLPVAGFHLSNSLQHAAENHPLLITPIPSDTLIKVESYKSRLIREKYNPKNLTICELFDSKSHSVPARRYEPLSFLDKENAGDVLSIWTDQDTLKGLNGNALKERMIELNFIKEGSLTLPPKADLQNFLNQQTDGFSDFESRWDIIADILANSNSNFDLGSPQKEKSKFLNFLRQFLNKSFDRSNTETDKELVTIPPEFFQSSLGDLLHRPYRIEHLIHATKYTALNWSEYFTIKILWQHAPDKLLTISAEKTIELSGTSEDQSNVIQLSLLSQITNEISQAVAYGIDDVHQNKLLRSKNGLYQWMAINAIERELNETGGIEKVKNLISNLTNPEQIQALGWMLNRAASKSQSSEIYDGLLRTLREILPTTMDQDSLYFLVNSLLGHMRELSWSEPWLFRDVILYLLQNGLAKSDDACRIWIDELVSHLTTDESRSPRLFEASREGQTTKTAAFLFAYSNEITQTSIIEQFNDILVRQRRILQQPLASTSNWSKWNDALVVSIWILSFARWAEYYLQEQSKKNVCLEKLAKEAEQLTLLRPLSEWRSNDIGNSGQLYNFLKQAEDL